MRSDTYFQVPTETERKERYCSSVDLLSYWQNRGFSFECSRLLQSNSTTKWFSICSLRSRQLRGSISSFSGIARYILFCNRYDESLRTTNKTFNTDSIEHLLFHSCALLNSRTTSLLEFHDEILQRRTYVICNGREEYYDCPSIDSLFIVDILRRQGKPALSMLHKCIPSPFFYVALFPTEYDIDLT